MSGRLFTSRLKRAAFGIPTVVQAGHPVLRCKAADVTLEELKSSKIQEFIETMVCVRDLHT